MKMDVRFSTSLGFLLVVAQIIGADAIPQPCTPKSYTMQLNTFKTRSLHLKRVLINGVETQTYSQIFVRLNSGDCNIPCLADILISDEVSLVGLQVDSLRMNSVSTPNFIFPLGAPN
jgi:hypothetical protein